MLMCDVRCRFDLMQRLWFEFCWWPFSNDITTCSGAALRGRRRRNSSRARLMLQSSASFTPGLWHVASHRVRAGQPVLQLVLVLSIGASRASRTPREASCCVYRRLRHSRTRRERLPGRKVGRWLARYRVSLLRGEGWCRARDDRRPHLASVGFEGGRVALCGPTPHPRASL